MYKRQVIGYYDGNRRERTIGQTAVEPEATISARKTNLVQAKATPSNVEDDEIAENKEENAETEEKVPVSYTHLDVYKRQEMHMKKENQSQPAEEVQEKDNRRSNRSMGILTVDASGVLAERDTGDTAWHELVNAYRTKKILSGDLGGIERLEGGWVVAVVYYKGCRILIPMEEMRCV